jgi:PEP-CTERM motif-containing protein
MDRFFRFSTAVFSVVVAIAVALGSQVAVGAILTVEEGTELGSIHFERIIPSNSSYNVASQLVVDVYGVNGDSQVLFIVHNLGPEQSTIKKVLFDDGALFGTPTIYNSVVFPPPGTAITLDTEILVGVSYTALELDETSQLPGGTPYNFVTTAGFGAIAATPPPNEGANAGESVGLLFDLVYLLDATDVWAAINLVPDVYNPLPPGSPDGSLRIGLHVINLGDGESDGYISIPPDEWEGQDPVPEPTSLVIWGLGLLACVAVRFQRRKRHAA